MKIKAAAERYGPNGIERFLSLPRVVTIYIPTTAPVNDERIIVAAKHCHPNHAPIAASNLKSPCPNPVSYTHLTLPTKA